MIENIRDEIVAAGGLPYILQLISSQKEQTIKLASFVLATMSVDGIFLSSTPFFLIKLVYLITTREIKFADNKARGDTTNCASVKNINSVCTRTSSYHSSQSSLVRFETSFFIPI